MYIQGVMMNNTQQGFLRNRSNGVIFKQKSGIPYQQTEELVNKYLKNFSQEIVQYRAEGDILQPSAIPIKTLQQIAQKELLKMVAFPAQHKLFIITGRIGGGKTTFVQQNNLQKLFYTPDADEIKLLLPGYKERGSSYVHKASCTINMTNINEAFKRGINTIIQTATTIDNLDDIIDEARDYKYQEITLIHLDTDEETAIKRAEKRGKLTGRKINQDIIKDRKYIDEIVKIYENPNRGLSELIVYDNNGASPVKIKNLKFNSWQEILTYVTESDD